MSGMIHNVGYISWHKSYFLCIISLRFYLRWLYAWRGLYALQSGVAGYEFTPRLNLAIFKGEVDSRAGCCCRRDTLGSVAIGAKLGGFGDKIGRLRL